MPGAPLEPKLSKVAGAADCEAAEQLLRTPAAV